MFLTNAEANADETLSDDTIAADAQATITVGTQPTDQTTSSGAATFTVAAVATTAAPSPSSGRREQQALPVMSTSLVQPLHLWHLLVKLHPRMATSIVSS